MFHKILVFKQNKNRFEMKVMTFYKTPMDILRHFCTESDKHIKWEAGFLCNIKLGVCEINFIPKTVCKN